MKDCMDCKYHALSYRQEPCISCLKSGRYSNWEAKS